MLENFMKIVGSQINREEQKDVKNDNDEIYEDCKNCGGRVLQMIV